MSATVGSEPVISIIYLSNAVTLMSSTELDDILETSQRRNVCRGVTGMLVYTDGSFIQAVEGDENVVDGLVAHIAKDPRHHDLVVLARYPIGERQFPDWSMGFRRCDGAPPGELADAFFNIRKPILTPDAVTAGGIAHKLIEGFRLRSRG